MTRLVVVALRCPHCRKPMPRHLDELLAAQAGGRPVRCAACGGDATVKLRVRVETHAYTPPVLALLGAEDAPSEAAAVDLQIVIIGAT